jgi:NADH dehydrogenase (ubiquinone) Fe-S protein 6
VNRQAERKSPAALNTGGAVATSHRMESIPPPEVIRIKSLQVACDGSGDIVPELGHPRVFLRIDEDLGFVECGYCDRRFVLIGGPADSKAA